MIHSLQDLENTIEQIGMLPFFANNIPGFSIEQMIEPGLLFGDDGLDGAWEWKGPVIHDINAAYGKLFRRKAGFVSASVFPDFLNYRRHAYPVDNDSTEMLILEIVRNCHSITSAELRREIFGLPASRRKADMPVDMTAPQAMPKRGSLETPLQRLQMSGRLIVSDFEYKRTRYGQKYGWGVARYSTPENIFGRDIANAGRTPASSFAEMVKRVSASFPHVSLHEIRRLLL